MTEIWKDVPGWETRYQVSDQGNVRSLDRTTVSIAGRTRFMRGRLLSPTIKDNGYKIVALRHGPRDERLYVHSLVLSTFVGPRPPGMYCCHFDGDSLNNALTNLRWDTPTANLADMVRHGRTNPSQPTTHCKNGHEFAGDNLKIDWMGRRICRTCYRAWRREYRRKQKEAQA